MSFPVFMVPAGDVLPIFFDSFAGSTGASITLTGLAVTDIEIYKDGGVTQRASDAGYTLLDTDGIDFDGTTGIHGFSIDTGDNTDAGFYTVGAWFTVVVSAVTIDSQTVSFVAAMFRLMAAESVAAKPKVDVDAWLGTAAATPTVNGVPEVDLTHVAGSTTSVSTIATTLATLLADIGGVATAAADGDPTNTDLLFSYVKQILNVLMGSAGIVAWPAAAAPGNAVSIAEALRYLYDQVGVAGAGLTAADDAVIAAIPSAATNAAAVWDKDATAHQTQGTFGQAIGDPVADTGTLYKAVVSDATGATVGIDVVDLKTQIGTAGAGLTAADDAVIAALATVQADTDDLQVQIGTAGAGLTAIPDSAGTTTLLGRLSAARAGYLDNLSAGAVALASKLTKYVQLLARKDAAIATDNATELTAINANGGSGAGAFDNTTDAEEALRDRGDAAWVTATGFSTLDAAGVRTAVGLASANLDTQLGDLPTNAELTTALGTADDAVLAAIAALNNLSQANIRTAVGLASANLDTQLGDLPTAAEAATAVGALVIEGAVTLIESLRLSNAAAAGKISGGGTTSIKLRNLADTIDRITATVDADGNRSAVTLVLT